MSEGDRATYSVPGYPVLLNVASVVVCQVYKIEISLEYGGDSMDLNILDACAEKNLASKSSISLT